MIPWRGKTEAPKVPILDTGYLERLAGHLGSSITAELLADGMLELADRLERLQQLSDRGDVEGLLRLTHDITGASGHLGLSAMSQYAAAANRDLRQATGSAVGRAVRPLLDVRNTSIDALGQYCRSRGLAKEA